MRIQKALAIKYRPQSFEDVVEQTIIKTVLTEQLKTKTFKNAYLFVGGAGTGKTTCARIFAHEINQGKGTPIEIDGASNNGVDNVREIIEKSNYQALDANYKIYIIDECVTGDTEILTENGFIRIDNVELNCKVAQYNDDGSIEFVYPTELVHHKYNGDMYRVYFRNGRKSVLMSPHHVQPLRMRKTGKIVERYIKDCKFAQSNEVIVSGMGKGDNRKLTYLERLFIALQADGYCDKNGLWELHLMLPEKIKRAKYLLDKCCIPYKEYTNDRNDNISIRFNVDFPVSKKFRDYFKIEMGYDRAKEFIDELLLWDGSLKSGYPGYYSCTDKDNVDFVAAILTQSGCSGNQGVSMYENDNHKDVHFINWFYTDSRPSTACSKKLEHFNGDIYCVKVPSQKIILRAQGFTFISGNCHMLSNGAWNAMLKLIEEPPALTVFIFCTTDPQKIPATILSRVQRYDFKKISEQAIIKRLEFVLESEDIKSYEPEALFYISKIAAGGMRDALTLLDKCISYNQLLTIDNVTTVLGMTSYDILFDLTDYIMNNDTKNILLTIDEIDKKGIDLRQFISQYLQFTLDLQKYFILLDFTRLNIPGIYEPILKNWQQNGKRNQLLQLLDIIINLNDTIRYVTNIKTIIEATFLLFTEVDK